MSTTPNDAPVTKAEFSAAIQYLKAELSTAIQVLKEYIDERTHDAETRLLRAFSDYQSAQNIRFARLKADVGNIDTATDQRITALEERMTNIDKRLIQKGI
ncbi:MAG: hypothetical protein ACRD4O_13465 [Bryobacteraceae bacterium]